VQFEQGSTLEELLQNLTCYREPKPNMELNSIVSRIFRYI